MRHGVHLVLSTPYHPEGNGVAERDGQTLANVLFRICGDRPSLWPVYLSAALHATRTTTSRTTGYTPFFLLFGRHCLFPFDQDDRTWYCLDWDKVTNTEELLALRAIQIARREEDIGVAKANTMKTRQRAIDDYMKRNARRVRERRFEPGTWVLVHETWLDAQHGNKGALRWAGPYVVVRQLPSGSYEIAEIDGTRIRDHVAASRLKLFYFRDDHQEMKTPGLVGDADMLLVRSSGCPREPVFAAPIVPQYPTLGQLADAPTPHRYIDYMRGSLVESPDAAYVNAGRPLQFNGPEVLLNTDIRDALRRQAAVGRPWW
ncbi:hypothetical protein CERSUDRAFT_60606 [Gelatoporia subvermispora B]|uniref:Integrase catalytic domain-containing protein n=1 Tax=Ceriporiopsis subvermispora (strain B) TaxID=914234 RepID=M2Q2J4_CERS8|nr:hypothetical protein CERSUDRAFT_60606 [Gelatoporia subvermispora B]